MRIGDVLVIIFVIILMVILLPIILPISIFLYIKDKIVNRRFLAYLKSVEGKKYFCYTNRSTSYAYVRDEILPFLPADTEVIYITDKSFNLGNDTPFLLNLVLTMKKTKGGFPYASVVSQGALVSKSINNELYSAIKRNIGADTINHKICGFYEYHENVSPLNRNC